MSLEAAGFGHSEVSATATPRAWRKACRSSCTPWTCPDQTGQAAWFADCEVMNSRGERMLTSIVPDTSQPPAPAPKDPDRAHERIGAEGLLH